MCDCCCGEEVKARLAEWQASEWWVAGEWVVSVWGVSECGCGGVRVMWWGVRMMRVCGVFFLMLSRVLCIFQAFRCSFWLPIVTYAFYWIGLFSWGSKRNEMNFELVMSVLLECFTYFLAIKIKYWVFFFTIKYSTFNTRIRLIFLLFYLNWKKHLYYNLY